MSKKGVKNEANVLNLGLDFKIDLKLTTTVSIKESTKKALEQLKKHKITAGYLLDTYAADVLKQIEQINTKK